MYPQQWPQQQQQPEPAPPEDETDTAHRPPNAFVLYSIAMRSQIRQENPTLSNIEVSRLLGKMWKEVPGDMKLKFKQKAADAQELFKREHPNYTYRKARKKRALNELLTKSSQGFAGPAGFPTDAAQMALFAASPFMMPGIYGQAAAGAPQGQLPPGMGMPNMGMPMQPGTQAQALHQYPAMPGYPAMGDAAHGLPGQMFQYPRK
jgi:transcription factor SOX7/8/10/18 (SOX group E/F)